LRIALVLRSGGEFKPEHVQALAFQLSLYAPNREVVVLSDVDVPGVRRIPLKTQWMGWWAKMELFRPDIEGDLLFFDLDTVIRGDLSDVLANQDLTVLRDFYRDGTRKPLGLQSSMMFLPEADRAGVWAKFRPELIAEYKRKGVGDQAFLESLWSGKAKLWQDLVPGQVVSYKVHCKNNGVPEDARVVTYHGKPRPWDAEGQKWLSNPIQKSASSPRHSSCLESNRSTP
jgi:hypothetical protein